MRIIAGHFRGINIAAPKGLRLRPTANHVREAIFNVLTSAVEGSVVLDLFAGSGAFGFEALSRGAQLVVFVDSSREACKHIEQVGERLAVQDRMRTLNMRASQAVKLLLNRGETFSVIFMDPPYYSNLDLELFQIESFFRLLKEEGLIIYECSTRTQDLSTPPGMENVLSRKYGETIVNIFSRVYPEENEIW